jgi:hypothetical protein
MSELRDVRAKITVNADQVLDAVARASGRDKSELIREVLDKWAAEKVHEATLIVRLAIREGTGAA